VLIIDRGFIVNKTVSAVYLLCIENNVLISQYTKTCERPYIERGRTHCTHALYADLLMCQVSQCRRRCSDLAQSVLKYVILQQITDLNSAILLFIALHSIVQRDEYSFI